MTHRNDLKYKRMKHLFLIFLKQFEVNEYKTLMQFLNLVIDKYNLSPTKLFTFLTNQLEAEAQNNEENSGIFEENNEIRKHFPPATLAQHSNFKKSLIGSSKLLFNKNKNSHSIKNVLKTAFISSNNSVEQFIENKSESQSSFSCTDSNSSNSSHYTNFLSPNGNKLFKKTSSLKYKTSTESDSFGQENQINHDANDDTSIDCFDENYEPDSMIINSTSKDMNLNCEDYSENKMLDSEMLANKNEIINSFIMKEDTDSIDEFDSNNEENEQTFIEENNQQFEEDEQEQPQWNSQMCQALNVQSLIRKKNSHNRLNQSDLAQQPEAKARIRKFSEAIRFELEKSFLANNFISGTEKGELACRLELTERQVQKWFVHRREKLRKLEKKAALTNDYLNATQPVRSSYLLNNRTRQNQQNRSLSENLYQKIYNNYRQMKNESLNEQPITNIKNEYDNEFDENEEIENLNENDSFNQNAEHNGAYDGQSYVDNNASINETFNNEFESFEDGNYENYDDNSELYEDDNMDTKHFLIEQQNLSQIAAKSYLPKSSRRLFPPEVITHLEKVFDTEKYLKDQQVENIAHITKLSEKQIRSWFKQRRYRYNQENKKNGIETDISFKQRDCLSQSVVVELEKSFIDNNYIFGENKKCLCRRLNLKPIQVERWFYYRRKKDSNPPHLDIGIDIGNDIGNVIGNVDVNQTF